ncbi:hypothetical protein NT07LI_0612 [Listeria innocua FSL S4-378]|nr:hypothetical protein NT07LI_0612 [Listeria innocua FSL S4-378]
MSLLDYLLINSDLLSLSIYNHCYYENVLNKHLYSH